MPLNNQLSPGMTINISGKIYRIESCVKVSMTKGSPFIKAKLRNLMTEEVSEKNFKLGQSIKPLILHGNILKKYIINDGTKKILDINSIEKHEIIFTNYETVRRFSYYLAQIKWEVVICDEAQWIKNPSARKTLAIKALNTNFRIITTATPIENSLDDLWTLFDFVSIP